MIDILQLDFMQRALIAALLTGLAAPAVGTFLVQRRMSLMGDGLGHVGVTGVALGLLTHSSPTWTAVLVAIVGAVLIETIRASGHTNGDVALALLFYGGLAGGVLITGLAGQSAAQLQGYLFGSILTVSPANVRVTLVLALVIMATAIGLMPQLFAVAQDQEFAQVAGLHVRFYNLLVAVLAAVTVTVAMRTVGLLLVSALMIVPVATSQQLTRSFRSTMTVAMVLGAAASLGGLLVSAYVSLTFDARVAPGSSVVLLSLVGFALTWPIGVVARRRQELREPFPEISVASHTVTDHQHVHGEDCGHPGVAHADHVDYIHDGHRHAPHGEHYDEH